MNQVFEYVHKELEQGEKKLYKGIQLYFSPLRESEILFIGINPGIGYSKYNNKNVKRLNPLEKFEYSGQKYLLATQTKKVFTELELGLQFSQAVKINQFPFATTDEKSLKKLLDQYGKTHKLYYLSKKFVLQTIEDVKPKLIICEGKSSFDRLKNILQAEPVEYNENTYVLRHNNYVVIGYKRHLSFIKDKEELKEKIMMYYKKAAPNIV
ncbi:hypothetical protein ACD591_19150 [Rufibacter glacialis]|uniref:Uracil-DNA glycosylase-like domain-containing protein n=1 Tax=Rufibacter glacialis TaxID=1259555 RepID=A0A5M8QUC1_9BACT|nr:hypothetical protein [Rufibacter glacialis]KAA6438063.1 hypothetical protein FOE74_00005 [Rufibacter glacialis]GGK88231.1 hypothetical protein GCM10011405_39980 [Rufibacter glacialis]